MSGKKKRDVPSTPTRNGPAEGTPVASPTKPPEKKKAFTGVTAMDEDQEAGPTKLSPEEERERRLMEREERKRRVAEQKKTGIKVKAGKKEVSGEGWASRKLARSSQQQRKRERKRRRFL